MRYIDKTGKEPEAFRQWKEENKDILEKLYGDTSITTKRLWRLIDRQNGVFNKKALRTSLLKEQGYICCYCGRRILDHPSQSVIDHLLPKSRFKEKTYDYDNLLASCVGGSRNLIHILQEGETLDSIARDYGVSLEDLEKINVSQNQVDVLRKIYELDQLKAGDQIIIILKSNGARQHCDSKKRNHILPVHPLLPDCEEKFRFQILDGSVEEVDEEAKYSIEKLGLNANPFLVQQRKRVIDEAYRKLEALLKVLGTDKFAFNAAREKLLLQYLQPNEETGMLPPFSFVTATILKKG